MTGGPAQMDDREPTEPEQDQLDGEEQPGRRARCSVAGEAHHASRREPAQHGDLEHEAVAQARGPQRAEGETQRQREFEAAQHGTHVAAGGDAAEPEAEPGGRTIRGEQEGEPGAREGERTGQQHSPRETLLRHGDRDSTPGARERGSPRDWSDDAAPLAPAPLRALLVALGGLCVGLAALGVVTPVLPTTPFLLVAAACFARSSPRFHGLLLNSPAFGPLIRDWREHRAIPRRAKHTALALIAATVGSSALFAVEAIWLRLVLLAVGVGLCTWLWRLPSLEDPRRL